MGERVSALDKLRAAVSVLNDHGFANVRFRLVVERSEDGLRYAQMDGIGVVDLRAWRCAVDYGAYAEVFDQGRLWQGASGVRRSELGDAITPYSPTPLTLVAFAEAAIDATELGTEMLADEECVRLRARADLARLAASHQPPAMPPEVLPEPDAVPFDAFLSESGLLRRARWQSAYQPLSPEWVTWVELEVVGVGDSIEVDWTKMPVYQPVEDDLEMTSERLEQLERLVERIERFGPLPIE